MPRVLRDPTKGVVIHASAGLRGRLYACQNYMDWLPPDIEKKIMTIAWGHVLRKQCDECVNMFGLMRAGEHVNKDYNQVKFHLMEPMSCEWKRSAGFLHVANVHLVLMYHWSHKWKKEVRYRNGYTVEQNGNTYRQNFTLAMRLLSDILLDTAPFFYAMPWKVVDDDLMINRREIQGRNVKRMKHLTSTLNLEYKMDHNLASWVGDWIYSWKYIRKEVISDMKMWSKTLPIIR